MRSPRIATVVARGAAIAVALGASFALVACGGPPALQNAPRPNAAVMAGAAAAVAGGLTLADPQAAARKQEQKKDGDAERKARRNDVHVPADVLDRLDAQKAEAPGEPAAPAPPAAPATKWPPAGADAPAPTSPPPAPE